MEAIRCANCRKPFQPRGEEDFCPACAAKDNEQFKVIKEYMIEHPGSSMADLVNNLGVSVTQIKHYLKEERLEIRGAPVMNILNCEVCGIAIRTGRYCNSCARDQYAKEKQQINEATRRVQTRSSERASDSGKGSRDVRFKSQDKK